jgi:hypothetical protein
MSQAYPSFSCSKFTTHFTPGRFTPVISFDEWVGGICFKNAAAVGASISQPSEQMFLMVDNETQYQLNDCLLSEMILVT